MRDFLYNAAIFSLPLLFLFGGSFFVLFHFGELRSLQGVIAMHDEGDPYILGRAYVPFQQDVKYALLAHTEPNITTLGNSRVLQFREEFFTSTTTFYNYAQTGSIGALSQYLDAVKKGELKKPMVLLVGLEQSYFLRDSHEAAEAFIGEGVGDVDWLSVISTVIKDVFAKKISGEDLLDEDTNNFIGTKAHLLHAGYRNDGSYDYGDVIPNYTHPEHEDHNFNDSIRRIERGINLFAQGSEPTVSSVATLREFLEEADAMNIHVVAFLPPYAPTVYAQMERGLYNYTYQEVLAQTLTQVFRNYPHTFFDFSDPKDLNLTDDDFFDGFHGGETAYARITQKAAQRDAVFREYIADFRIEQAFKQKDPASRYLFDTN